MGRRRKAPPGSLRGLDERVVARSQSSLRSLDRAVCEGDPRPDALERAMRPRRGRGARRGPRALEVHDFDRGEPVGRPREAARAPAPSRSFAAATGAAPAWDADLATSGAQGAGPFEVEAFDVEAFEPAPAERPAPSAPAAPAPAPDLSTPSTPSTPSPPPHLPAPPAPNPSDDEIDQDLAALTGRDATEVAADAARAREKAEAMARGQAAGRRGAPPERRSAEADDGGGGPPANPHAVFDRIAQNLNFATTFDLGSMALERRLDQFEREVEADEARARMQQAPAYELGLKELDEDLAALGHKPPPALAVPKPPPVEVDDRLDELEAAADEEEEQDGPSGEVEAEAEADVGERGDAGDTTRDVPDVVPGTTPDPEPGADESTELSPIDDTTEQPNPPHPGG